MIEVVVRSEPTTYHERAKCSYFQDLFISSLHRPGENEARARLEQNEREMAVIRQTRDARMWREFRAGGFEYRTEPNLTDGTGGYFTPPLWLDNLFATANRPHRVLASLIGAKYPLPQGVSSINIPIISTGTETEQVTPTSATPDQDVTDALGTSIVAVFAGDADTSLQLLEQSPPGAHLDHLFLKDLSEDYDAKVEEAILYGLGSSWNQLLGVANVASNVQVTYTDGTPTGHAMWPYFGQLFAQVAKGRKLPPECWIMRAERWAWFMSQEDSGNLPFGVLSPDYLGHGDSSTPFPVGPLYGIPTFLDQGIPEDITFGSSIIYQKGTQDFALCVRPSDMVILEGSPKTAVMLEPNSGALGARIQLHNSVAFIGNRRPAGIGVVGGTGFAIQSGF